jgi:hypothetical protein
MKRILVSILCVSLLAVSALGQGNQFQFRYVGGSISSTVKPDDWHNDITVTSEQITLKFKDGQEIKIDPKMVKSITHGHHASRRIGAYAAAAIISPIFLLGMLKKNKRNFVGIEYETSDGKKQGVNLQIKNEKYKALLTALSGVTGVKVEEEADESKNKKK